MKTALTIIIDNLQEKKLIDFLDWFSIHAEELIDMEREQIVDAFESGQRENANGYYTKLGEQYFNKTFINDNSQN